MGRLALDCQRKNFPSRRAYVRARVLRCHRQGKRDEDRYADVDVLRLSVSCGYETRALGNICRYPTNIKAVEVVPPSVLIWAFVATPPSLRRECAWPAERVDALGSPPGKR